MNTEIEADLRNAVLNTTAANFTEIALRVFTFQYLYNETYRKYCDLLSVRPGDINSIENIPYLPIQFFKTKSIKTTDFKEKMVFESSGTTASVKSRHFIKDIELYEESFLKSFRLNYGDENKLCIIGLLPSYLERQNASLVYMVQKLINNSGIANSGFYLDEYQKLKEVLMLNEAAGIQTLLLGVTYALIEFAEKNAMQLNHTIVMETGGLKGRREELSREQVHEILKSKLGLQKIHSEYGMTELLSQAYSCGEGIFTCPPWMRILIRKEDDPFEITAFDKTDDKVSSGAINIIDLANIYSCAFIATDDLGKIYSDARFEVTGRMENTDSRGCGLMIL